MQYCTSCRREDPAEVRGEEGKQRPLKVNKHVLGSANSRFQDRSPEKKKRKKRSSSRKRSGLSVKSYTRELKRARRPADPLRHRLNLQPVQENNVSLVSSQLMVNLVQEQLFASIHSSRFNQQLRGSGVDGCSSDLCLLQNKSLKTR